MSRVCLLAQRTVWACVAVLLLPCAIPGCNTRVELVDTRQKGVLIGQAAGLLAQAGQEPLMS